MKPKDAVTKVTLYYKHEAAENCSFPNFLWCYMLYYIRFFYAEKIFSGTECIKQIYTVPEVNWSLGSLDKAEVSSSNSLSISAIRRGSHGALFPANSNGINGDFIKRNNLIKDNLRNMKE